MKCRKCGTENPEGMNFCQECGRPLKKDDAQREIPAPLTCPTCGYANRPGVHFCEECGFALSKKPRRAVRFWLAAIFLAIAVAIPLAFLLTPEISRGEAVNLTRERVENLYPGVSVAEPVVQINRSGADTIYNIEYQTDMGKIIFIVDAETGETLMIGSR